MRMWSVERTGRCHWVEGGHHFVLGRVLSSPEQRIVRCDSCDVRLGVVVDVRDSWALIDEHIKEVGHV